MKLFLKRNLKFISVLCLRERYVLSIAPLLVHSQRKLLERIASFGGPAVPQPHHVKTQKATGEKVGNTQKIIQIRLNVGINVVKNQKV